MDTDLPRALRFLARAAHLAEEPPADLDDEAVGSPFPLQCAAPPPARPRPEVPAVLVPWISGDVDRPGSRLRLRARAEGRRLGVRPDVRREFETWHATWREWSEREAHERPTRARYERILHAADLARDGGHDVLLGVGLLTTTVETPAGPRTLRRHVLTTPVVVEVDDAGTAHLRPDAYAHGLALELRAVSATHAPSRAVAAELHAAARAFEGSPLEQDDVEPLLDRVRAALTGATGAPELTWSPMILSRPRRVGDPDRHRRVADDLDTLRRTPRLAQVPPVRELDEIITAAPLSEAELAVLDHADRFTETVVDTGGLDGGHRTRLVAALVAHELQQGRRVLVTGPGSPVLVGLRDALPADLRPLAVTVPEASASADDLTTAVEAITRCFTELDRTAADADLARRGEALAERWEERRRLLDLATASRESETLAHTRDGITAPLADLVRRHRAAAAEHGWLADLVEPPSDPDAPCPFDTHTLADALDVAGDARVAQLAAGFHGRVPDLAGLPTPSEFTRLVREFDTDTGRAADRARYAGDPVVGRLADADDEDRARLGGLLADLTEELSLAAAFPGEWMEGTTHDLLSATPQEWHRATSVLGDLVEDATAALAAVGHTVDVLDTLDHPGPRARYLRDHLREHGPLPVDHRGIPLGGVDLPDHVRAADPLFRFVRVDGRPPTRLEDVEAFLAHLEATCALDDLDAVWPASTVIPECDSPADRLAWHRDQWEHFRRIVGLPERLATVGAQLTVLGVPTPDWTDATAVSGLRERLAAAEDRAAAAAHAAPLTRLVIRVREELTEDCVDAVRTLHDATIGLDPRGYARAWSELAELEEHRARVATHLAVVPPLQACAPRLLTALRTEPRDRWQSRLPRVDEAWRWVCTEMWLEQQRRDDPTAFTDELTRLDAEIRRAAAAYCGLAAWRHAVRAERLDPSTRMALTLHTHLRRRLATAGGSPRQYRELARIRHRCRAAVPAWCVPWSRVPDVFLDSFGDLEDGRPRVDTVIVLDADRLPLDATVLRAIAPRIVLVGRPGRALPTPQDPRSRDRAARRAQLAERYLGARFADLWGDPATSLITEAARRHGVDVRLGATSGDAGRTGDATHGGEGEGCGPEARAVALTETAERLASVLSARGYDVGTGMWLDGRRVDLVLRTERHEEPDAQRGEEPQEHTRGVVVLCETSAWNGPEDYREGLRHQRRIERRGWVVHRVRESDLEIDPARALATLRRVLVENGVRPRTHGHGDSATDTASGAADTGDPAPAVGPSAPVVADPAPPSRRRLGVPARRRGVRA